MHKPDAGIEPVLARHLRPVSAPPELWRRIQHEHTRTRFVQRPVLWWSFAAALIFIVVTGGVSPHSSKWWLNEALAAQALGSPSHRLDLASDSADEIRAWVKEKTGFDVPLNPNGAPGLQLCGARVMAGRRDPVAEITYRVHGREAALIVSKASVSDAPSTHRDAGISQWRGNAVSSWTLGGQLYTLAAITPEALEAACTLCHAEL